MEWIAKNPGVFITVIVLVIGNVWSLAVALEQARQTKKMVETLEEKFDWHLKEQGLHRTPDSEARITRIDSGINALNAILIDVKENVAALRAGNKQNN